MNPERRQKLQTRVRDVASAALSAQGHVSPIDVLTGIRWLDVATLERWKQSRLPYLLQGIQTSADRITEAMELFHAWATEQNLVPMEIAYIAHGPSRAPLNSTHPN